MNNLAATQKQQLLEISERLMRLDPAKQHAFLKQLAAKGVNLSMLPIARQKANRAPLSFAQTRLWFLWRMDPASPAYNMAATVRVRGPLDLDALQRAFDALIARHEALCTVFRQADGEPEQIVMPPRPIQLRRADVAGEEDAVTEALRIAREDTTAPFDLENGPLLRVSLIALGADDHLLAVTLHHIIADGWSMGVLVDEFWKLYAASRSGGTPPLPDLHIQYPDYASWQRLWISAVEGERQLGYWTKKLADPPVLQLPLDRPRPATPTYDGAAVRISLDASFAEDVRSLARRNNTTLFVVLLASLKLLLSRHSGQTDISVGVPVANRDRFETRGLIGLFVNTQVLRTAIDGQQPVSDFIASVHATTMESQQNQDLPFERLLEILQPQRSLSQSPLFQVLYNHQRQQTADEAPQNTGLQIEKFEAAVETVKFDLSLDTEETAAGEIRAVFSFAKALFDRASIERLAAHWLNLLRSLARTEPARPVADLQMLSAEELAAVRNWNAGVWAETAAFEPVHRMFAERARKAPDAPALIFGDVTVTYGELDRRADRLANFLIERGVGAETLVGISARRSPELIGAYLAVLKTGAAYLPLDPDHPGSRRDAILQDSGARFLLTDTAGADDSCVNGVVTISLDQIERGAEDRDRMPDRPDIPVHEQSRAYVIYTSGSTGMPKGVEVAHGAFAMHCRTTADLYDMDSRSRELHFLSFTFDGAHERLWTALICGAALVMRDDDLWSAERTLGVLRDKRVSNAGFPPSYLQQIAEFATWQGDPPPVELYSFGGEAMPKAGFDLVKRALKPRTLINGYGPTETVVTPLVFKTDCDAEITSSYVPVGRPVGRRSAYVLDGDFNIMPAGVAGELYIGGSGLARGYLERRALSAERFIPDPFGAPGSRLYRTGDLARWRADGVVEYLGRSDHQVKIRGFRIELGEIEAQLMREPGVRETVVVAHEGGAGRQLIGYVAGDGSLSDAGLRNALANVLPDYMVPSRIVVLDRLPMTAHGKVDRDALPVPEVSGDREFVPPSTAAEITLATIWADLLGVEAVGRSDNFFELGGDSIISLQMVGRARQSGLLIEPRDVFQHQKLEELARAARTVTGDEEPAQAPSLVGAKHPLLPIQARFFSEEHGARHHWNQALLLTPAAPVDWDKFADAMAAVVAHHDALRLRFELDGDEWQATYGPALDVADFVEIHTSVSPGDEVTGIASAAQARLSLKGPLLRVAAMDLTDSSQRLLIAVHHLVIDAVSWRVLLEDIASIYGALQRGAAELPKLPLSQSYASWGARLQAYAGSETLAAELPYWLERTSGQHLPCDDDHGEIDRVDEGEEVALVINAELTGRLLKSAQGAYRTQINDLLLAALSRAVWRWSGSDDVVIELEGHGREDIFPGAEISRTVGWFTTAFPVRLPSGSQDDAALVKSVKEELRAIPARGLGFGVLRYLGAEAQRDALAAMAEPDIVFNYLGQFDGSVGSHLPFRLAAESAGATRSAYAPLGRWLSINGQVREGQLRVSFAYGRRRYLRQTIERLTEHFAAALHEIVDHCTSGVRGLTPSDIELSGLRQDDIDALCGRLDLADVEDIYPLSPMQQGMLFHTLRDGDSGAYVNQVAVDVHGLDPDRLAAAWQAVSDRHAILRTSFLWTDLPGQAQQVLQRRVAVPFAVEDWRTRAQSVASDELDDLLAEVAHAERAKGFDLSVPPLQRVKVIRLDESRYRLIWTHHHILLDGWSSARLIGEILQHERGERLAPVTGQYRDYIAWLLDRDHAASATFWQAALRDLDEPSLLADALSGPADLKTPGHGSIDLMIGAATTEALQAFARRERVTLNTIVQGAWAQLLRQHCRQRGVCFGATVAGRPADLAGAGEMVGLFINTLPVIDGVSPETDVGAWLRELQTRNVDARDHGWLPLNEIQRLAGRSGRALFDSILVFENYPIDEALRGGNDGRQSGRVEQVSITNYAMTVAVNPGANSLHLGFRYDRSRFDEKQVRHLQRSLQRILGRMVAGGAGKVGNLAVLDEESAREVSRWSGSVAVQTATDFNGGIVARIEAQAGSTSDAIALLSETGEVTYGELNARANGLAQQLQASGIGPGSVVGIAMDRGIEEIVAILAVLKAGGAYLPLDPDYPADRLAHMVSDSGASLLLTEEALLDQLSPVLQSVAVEVWREEVTRAAPATAAKPRVDVHPEDLAYVMYTSGSTGRPKGVACTHGALAARLGWMQAEYGFDRGDTLLHKTPFSFDVSVWEILLPLSIGARLAIAAPGAHREPKRLAEAVVAHEVTTLHFVPQMLEQFLAEPTAERCVSLKRLFAGGEALSAELAARVRSAFPDARFDNRYGPTETSINATFWPCEGDAPDRVPIGRPIPGTIVRILDGGLNEVPPGVTGELFVGGEGLARGYWQQQALTAERFIPDPFGKAGTRLYRTGDLARWRDDGLIEFAGRADHQIKIRGFRIELSEIEARLLEQPGVQSAVVVAREAGKTRQLAGYISGPTELDGAEIRERLATVLPDYMVPPRIVVLERLPLTPNGKIDRTALPAPDVFNLGRSERIIPRTARERALADIWSELLGENAISLDDNFFELGGDSIISLQMVSRARRHGLLIEPRDVFQHPTLEALARVACEIEDDQPQPEQGKITGQHELLPIQLRFFEHDAGARDHWNQAVMLQPRKHVDWDAMRRAVSVLVDHHDALRLRFEQRDGTWQATYGDGAKDDALFWVCDAEDGDAVTAIASSAQASLSLAEGDVVRAVGIDVADGSQRLLFVIHHLAVDGVSWRVLLEDLGSAYEQVIAGDAPVVLPPKSHAYAAWGARLKAYAGTPELAAELPYWLSRDAAIDAPRDNDSDEDDRVADADEVVLQLDADLTKRLLKDAPQAYRTQAPDLLLAGLARALWRWIGSADSLIELEGHGREDIFSGLDVSRTVGWFTTAFPVRLAGGSGDDATLIKAVKEELRAIPNRGIGYGVLRYLGDNAQRAALSGMRAPWIAFNYLGQIDGTAAASAAFALAPESAGRSRSDSAKLRHSLSINALVRDGQLKVSFGFGRKRFRAETVEALAAHYRAALTEITNHCAGEAAGVTPTDFALSGLTQTELDRLDLDWRNVEDIYPLSPMQQGMLFHALHDDEDSLYVNQVSAEVRGIDPGRLRAAWQAVSDRHAALRTGFIWRELSGAAQQVVYRQVEVPFTVDDWRDMGQTLAPSELESAIADIARRDRETGFDLSRSPLQRVRLIRLGEDRYWLIWTHHHILMDGWSSARLLAEMMQHEDGVPLPHVSHSYRDYIAWLQRRDREASVAFWREALQDFDEPSFLSTTNGTAASEAQPGHGTMPLAVDASLTRRVQQFAARERVTVNTVVQAAWSASLRRYGGQNRASFGVTVSGRPPELHGSEEIVGLFINTLPVVDTPRPDQSVGDWLRDLQDLNLRMREHGATPLYDIQRIAGRPGQPLFDSLLVFENYPIDQAMTRKDGRVRVSQTKIIETSNYPLFVSVGLDDGLHMVFNFQRRYFDEVQVSRLQAAFVRLLDALSTGAERAVGTIAAHDAGDDQGIQALNVMQSDAVRLPVHRQFEDRVSEDAERVALVCGAERVSYGELNVRANALARRLRAAGGGLDRVVALGLDRGVEMMVALLAVLKSGGAYLPLDPDYPAERLRHMLDDSGAKLVLTQEALYERFADIASASGAEIWLCDGGDAVSVDERNLDVAVHPESLAYVIYTSGSTGLPKGVMVRHDAVSNFIASMAEKPGIKASDRVLGLTSLSFDIAVLELFLPLTAGATVVLAGREAARDPERLQEIITAHGVSMIQATPSTWRMLADHDAAPLHTWLKPGCRVLCGGEALPPDLAQRLVAEAGEVWNLYGPTETTVWSARRRLDKQDARPVLGGPIANTTLYILDDALNVAPVGVAGELYIGGAGHARGYWKRAGMTAERFIPDPFGPPGARLYRTGDVARWGEDGSVEYLGRSDHQVKIRGFRIELGEIEARLVTLPGVKSAVVTARALGTGRQLVGYATGEDDLDGGELRMALAAQLPEHMVPARIVVLEQLPLTPNGKVDRKALPDPDDGSAITEYVAPRTATEAALAAIWSELLRRPRVGVTDNFFELGGDSIISLQMISRARQAGLSITPRDVFKHQTVEDLARAADQKSPAKKTNAVRKRGSLARLTGEQISRLGLDREEIEDFYPLSPMQQGMLFHALRDAGSGFYVNQVSVEIRGLDAARLEHAWRTASARHAMLRTGFLWRELSGSPLQVVHRDAAVPFVEEDWCGRSIDDECIGEALIAERRAEFDLSAPPLQRVRLIRLEDDLYRLIWTYHHILMDGWSSARFISEVLQLYHGRPLADAGAHYGDYIGWLEVQDRDAAERFWRGELARFEEPTQLTDAFGTRRYPETGHRRSHTRLNETATAQLKAFARRERITLNTVIQGVWSLLLQRYTGQSTVTFGVTVAGRPAALEGASEMLGLFINTLPVIEAPNPESSIGDWLRQLQERNAAIRDYEHTPLYDIQGWAGRAGQALFDSIIVFENYPIERSMDAGESTLSFGGLRNVDVTNYPMDLSVFADDVLHVEYTYMPSHFTDAEAERIRHQFEHLLFALTQNSAEIVGNIAAATDEDAAVAGRCNSHATAPETYPFVHDAISAHANSNPHRTALVIGARSLTYRDLDLKANGLANHLMARGLKPEVRVGVVVDRTVETVIALLAALKAGCAYVPLDPELPEDRISYIERDAGLSLILHQQSGTHRQGAPARAETLDLSAFDFDAHDASAPKPLLRPENLAYVIYTSGSTGRPKGVSVAHGTLAMHCRETGAVYEMDHTSCELHFLSLAFDGAHERLLTVLSHGGQLVMRDNELWTPERTVEALHTHRASHVGLPPAYLQQVADWVEQTGNPPPVDLYSFGGEAMPKAGFDRVRRVLSPRILINGYGPTETVISPLVWKVGRTAECDTPFAPIGLPVGDRHAYILDSSLNIVPAGVAGELYLGGSGLARGYHGKAAMSAERFLPDPFAAEPGARMYRTGDLARWLDDGTIVYLGRSDDQVKVNGFRIELGEIQSALLRYEAVDQAAVLALPGPAGNRLVAYVAVPEEDRWQSAGLAEMLSDHLRGTLPAYMVPSRIVVLDKLPLLSSGKVDRRALPQPDAESRAFVAPETPAEIAMARLWADLLKVPQVGVSDNFFELGGNSMLSLKVVARVRQDPSFGIEIKLADLLKKPTIRALLGDPGTGSQRTASPDTGVPPSALLPLSAAVEGARPVFCLHGGFGTVFDYRPLAQRLEGVRQVIGVQSRMLVAPSWRDRSLQAMAADYAQEILRTHPGMPYSLAGWSLGGVLAALVAAELERNGAKVDSLALVDSFVPRSEADVDGADASHWSDDLRRLLLARAGEASVSRIAAQLLAAKRDDLPETREAVHSLISATLADSAQRAGGDAAFGIDDLANAFVVGRHLQSLSRTASLPRDLAVAPHCWWTADRTASRERLKSQITNAVDTGVIGNDHFAILMDATFLDAICNELVAEPPRAAVMAVPANETE